jgi:hypothetical protein
MAQVLEMAAASSGLGLCQIGTVEFERVRHLFSLDDTHVLVHSLLGGSIGAEEAAAPDAGEASDEREEARAARVVQRVQQLSEAEVGALLEANRARQRSGPR